MGTPCAHIVFIKKHVLPWNISRNAKIVLDISICNASITIARIEKCTSLPYLNPQIYTRIYWLSLSKYSVTSVQSIAPEPQGSG